MTNEQVDCYLVLLPCYLEGTKPSNLIRFQFKLQSTLAYRVLSGQKLYRALIFSSYNNASITVWSDEKPADLSPPKRRFVFLHCKYVRQKKRAKRISSLLFWANSFLVKQTFTRQTFVIYSRFVSRTGR